MGIVDPAADPVGHQTTGRGPGLSRSRRTATLFEPLDEGVASAIVDRLRGVKPLAAFFTATLIGYVMLACAIVALGLLLTKILIPIDPIRHADEFVPGWMADHRTRWLTDASSVASRTGDVPALPALVALTLVVGAFMRRLRLGAFLLTAILIEVTLYRIGALAVPRQRPDVQRLDLLPVDESFPSGHVAASVVVYLGLALLVTAHSQRRWVAVLSWSVGIVLVLAVALSRIYRGMHHPLDTLAGALLGAGCLIVAVIAVRVFGVAQRRRAAGNVTPRGLRKDVT